MAASQAGSSITIALVGDAGVGKTTACLGFARLAVVASPTHTLAEAATAAKEALASEGRLRGSFNRTRRTFTALAGGGAGDIAVDLLDNNTCAGADVVLACFSVTDPATFESVKRTWWPAIAKEAPGVPVLLLGLQTDLRFNTEIVDALHAGGSTPVSKTMALERTSALGARGYAECYALVDDPDDGGAVGHVVEKALALVPRARVDAGGGGRGAGGSARGTGGGKRCVMM